MELQAGNKDREILKMPLKSEYRTDLEKQVKQQFKQDGILIKQGAAKLGISISKLHAIFQNHQNMEMKNIKIFADYLGVEKEHAQLLNSLKIHAIPPTSDINSATQEIEHTDTTALTPSHQLTANIKVANTTLLRYAFISILIIIAIFYSWNKQIFSQQDTSHQSTKYQASARDLSAQHLPVDEFNVPTYQYELTDFIINKNDGELTFTAAITLRAIATGEIFLTGLMNGKGYYFGDQASVSYRVVKVSNGDLWTGVFMFDLPSSGHASGYWLTSHNDDNVSGGYKYAIGNVILDRQNKE